MGSESRGAGGSSRPSEEEDDFGLADLLPQYLALCRRDLLNLRAALEQNDFVKIRTVGHNLKGSGAAYGFPELTEIGSSLETGGQKSEESAVKAGVDRLAEFLEAHGPKE